MKRFISTLTFMFLTTSLLFSLNFGEIKGLTRELVRDPIPATGDPHFSEVVISSYVNIVQAEITVNSLPLRNRFTWNVVTGQREYILDDDYLAMDRVTIDKKRIDSTSMALLDKEDSTWESSISTATPNFYYVEYTTYNAVLFDTYLSTTTETTIEAYCFIRPDNLTSDSDVPFDGQPRLYSYHHLICYGTAALLLYQDNRVSEADKYYAMYLDRIKNMETVIRLSPDYYPTMSGDRGTNRNSYR